MGARVMRRIGRWCGKLALCLFLSSLLAVVVYKYVPVYYTPLMLIRLYERHQDGKELRLEHEWVPMERIAQPLAQAVVASEDNRFMEHHGFDIEQIRLARDEAEKGRRVRGASTISQQTAKNVFLSQEKDLSRKVAEVFLAFDLESLYEKDEILELYVNTSYFGDGLTGIGAATQGLLHKKPLEMTPCECALMAGLPNAPTVLSSDPELAWDRARLVAAQMEKYGLAASADEICP